MISKIKALFGRRERQEPQPLRIEGVAPAPMTLEPGDAEQAAAALLELMAQKKGRKVKNGKGGSDEARDAFYYRAIADRMRNAHAASVLRTLRFVAFCEQELRNPLLPKQGPNSLALLESELYKRIDTVEREGGDLKRRWQHCLADVTVRLMEEEKRS